MSSFSSAASYVAWLRRNAAAIAVVLVVSALSWPVTPLAAAAGLDQSWMVGLSLALARGVSFASRVVFTYGPLGPVLHPVAVSAGTLVLALLGAVVIHVCLVALIVVLLRVRVGLPAAGAVALVVALVVTATPAADVLDAIAFGFVALNLAAPPGNAARWAWMLAVGGGVLAGLALLSELNQGVAVSVIVAVGVLGGPRPMRHVALYALSLVLALVCAWVALGQPIGAIPDYVVNGYQTLAGYADAMGSDAVGSSGDWVVSLVFASAITLSLFAWRSLRDAPVQRRAALVLAVVIVHYFVAREMFTRFDFGHMTAVALLPAIAVMLPWRREDATRAGVLATCIALASVLALDVAGVGVSSVFNPGSRVSSLVDDAGALVAPAGTIARGRAAIRAGDSVPASVVRALDGHCVNVDPAEVAVVFAYPAWRWCPIGVMQSYEAYTTRLDDLDAAGYANARTGPDRVLRQHYAIDDRNPDWESPAAMLSLLCHFREIARGGPGLGTWQALARIPDRCGHPYVLETLRVGRDGARLPAAPPGTVMIAKIYGLQVTGLEWLESFFTRARERTITINGASIYRVLPDTAEDGLILDVPPNVDYARPFNLGVGAETIRAAIGGYPDGKPVAFTAKLIAVPIT